ncbi:hypothetical protein BT69DRAFT_1344159 [Atractiella rhizophila]|nr:hypothetical protein BT69DRAFT_1344159 [Atractiella rhizophila]
MPLVLLLLPPSLIPLKVMKIYAPKRSYIGRRLNVYALRASSNSTTTLGVEGTESKSGAKDEEEKQGSRLEIEWKEPKCHEVLMAPPLSPSTTRRNMLVEEFSESLRRDLIRERRAGRRNKVINNPWDWATAI